MKKVIFWCVAVLEQLDYGFPLLDWSKSVGFGKKTKICEIADEILSFVIYRSSVTRWHEITKYFFRKSITRLFPYRFPLTKVYFILWLINYMPVLVQSIKISIWAENSVI